MWIFTQKIIRTVSSPEFIRFFISGVLAFFVDAGVLLFCTRVLLFNPEIEIPVFSLVTISISGANIVSLTISAIVSFSLQRYWTFKSTETGVAKQSGKYAMVFLFSYVLNNIIFGFLTFQLNVVDFLAKFIVSGLQMLWNFFLYKFFVFKK